MEISGKTARFLPDNLIQITGLRMTFYEEGKMTMQVSTPLCFFDRVKRTASSKVEVWANRVDLIIAGYGFYWSEKDGFIRINNDAMVVLKKNEEKTYFGAESAITSMPTALQYDTNNTVIISRKLAFDQKQSTVIFEGSVKVNDPALKIESDRLTVQLSNDKKVELIKAEGNVLITRDIIYAGSQLASYAVPEGKITLYGKPVINREKDSLTAETIVLWRNSNRIICEPQAHLIIYSEPNTRSQFKKD
jgi:lipopolysaccharide transport protein LptA